MRALAYLEFNYARHAAAAILRSPLRLALWLPYLVSIAYFTYARALRAGASQGALALSPEHATAVGGLYFGLLGVSIALAAGGRVTAFRTPSEPILFVNAGLPQLTLAVWLQLRKLAASWSRSLAGVVYFLLLFAPDQAGASVVRTFVATLLAFALQMTVELPAFLLGTRRYGMLLRTLAWATAAVGFAFAALGFWQRGSCRRSYASCASTRGSSHAAYSRAAGPPSAGFASGSRQAFGRSWFSGATRCPTSTPHRATRARAGATNSTRASPARARHAQFRRGLAAQRRSFGRTGSPFVTRAERSGAGSACARSGRSAVAALRSSQSQPATRRRLRYSASQRSYCCSHSLPAGAASGLAAELANPLFRLSSAPLAARVAAWTFARAWRGGIGLALAPLAAGAVSHDLGLAVGALPLTLVTYWSLQTLGVGLYALFPSALDARGPLVLLRTLATFAFRFRRSPPHS